MRVYQCEDSLEGVCTAIYRAYEDHAQHEDTWIRVDRELMLFGEYIPVETDIQRAEKVLRTLRRRFGQEDYESLCLALATPDPEKAQAVYRTVVYGLQAAPLPGICWTIRQIPMCFRPFGWPNRPAGNAPGYYSFCASGNWTGESCMGRITPRAMCCHM